MLTNQKLAPGSEWLIDDQILDCEKCTHFISNEEIVVCDQMASISVADAIALIDRANLDPVRVAARRLVELCTPGLLQSEYNRSEVAKSAKELKAIL